MFELSVFAILKVAIKAIIIIIPIIWNHIFTHNLKLFTSVLKLSQHDEKDSRLLSLLLSYMQSSFISLLNTLTLNISKEILLILMAATLFVLLGLIYLLMAFTIYKEKNPNYFAYKHAERFFESKKLKTLVLIILLFPTIFDLMQEVT
jgi:hypothetical protein